MNFIKKATAIAGCCEVLPTIRKDRRGAFVKIFHAPEFRKLGLGTEFKEAYYSVSNKGVLRGLHFQNPPAAIAKLIYCVEGEIIDAVVDLRRRSKTYGRAITVRLNAKSANMLYIPKGCAHGFYTVSKRVVMLYHTTGVYSPKQDTGLLWNSAGVNWPCKKPVLSPRDAAFPSFKDFNSPF